MEPSLITLITIIYLIGYSIHMMTYKPEDIEEFCLAVLWPLTLVLRIGLHIAQFAIAISRRVLSWIFL